MHLPPHHVKISYQIKNAVNSKVHAVIGNPDEQIKATVTHRHFDNKRACNDAPLTHYKLF